MELSRAPRKPACAHWPPPRRAGARSPYVRKFDPPSLLLYHAVVPGLAFSAGVYSGVHILIATERPGPLQCSKTAETFHFTRAA